MKSQTPESAMKNFSPLFPVKSRLFRILALAIAAGCAVSGTTALAQPRPAASVGNASKLPLDNLDDNRLMGEMANRGLTDLLEYYFKKTNKPEEKRKEIIVLISLQKLDSKDFATKSAVERKAEIDNIVKGIKGLLPGITDAPTLMRYASALITNGTSRQISILDIWGDNPKMQATLNPIAETVDQILERACVEYKKKSDALMASITSGNDPKIRLWEAADQSTKMAEYTRARASYGLALSYDRAAVDVRKKICDRAILALTQFDEEGSNVRVPVQLEIAKLHMAKGGKDGYTKSKEYFKLVIDAKPDDPKNPKQHVYEQYQARYFTLVADLLNGKADAAAAELDKLKAWQRDNLGSDKATVSQLEVAFSMLEFRIATARAELAKGPKEKDKLNNDATAILMDLVGKRPELKGIIFEQIIGKLSDNPDLKTLDALLLEALVNRGSDAVLRKSPEKDDAKHIQLAADSAREIVSRKGKPGVSNEQVDSAAFRIGVFEEYISNLKTPTAEEQLQNKKDAVVAYLTYVEKFGANKAWQEDALDQALSLINGLLKTEATSADINKLYDQVLELGMFKFGRSNLAWYYAQRRKELGDFKAAKKGYAMVKPDSAPMLVVMAKYYQMFCAQQLLDKATEAEKKPLSDDVQRLQAELAPLIESTIPKVDDVSKKQLVIKRVQVVLLAASVARANKEPAKVVELLTGFEAKLKDFPAKDQNAMLGNVLFLRVNALMALNKNSEALAQIDNIIATQPDQALGTIATLLEKINETFLAERSKDVPDMATMKLLTGQRAQLAQKLVDQAQKDPKLPEANRASYLSFNATANRQAAEMETDPVTRKAYLTEALDTYNKLLAKIPENDLTGVRNGYNRLIALTLFTVGDADGYRQAHSMLGVLLVKKQVGTALESHNGETRSNPLYWETVLRYLQCKVKLGAAGATDEKYLEDATRNLKNIIVQYGDIAGGEAYGKDFKLLRKEILGNWKPDDSATSQPASASQPAVQK